MNTVYAARPACSKPHSKHPDTWTANPPAWLHYWQPLPRTLHDLRLLAAAWRTSPGNALARLIRFYVTFNSGQTPAAFLSEVEVIAFYQKPTITEVYQRRSGDPTVISPPLPRQRSRRPARPRLPSLPRSVPTSKGQKRSGYVFWTLAKTGQKLRTIRHL